MSRRTSVPTLALAAATALVLAACGSGSEGGADADDDATGAAGGGASAAAGGDLGVDEIRLDWATYNPASLVLKEQGWVEEAVGDDVEVTWEFSAGSAPANELLRGDVVDFNSTAGAAALLARANGSPLRTVDVLAQPEWSAIVVGPDSDITSAEDLEGRTIAALSGTDPYFFLLQTLDSAGLTTDDVQIVDLPHADGRLALNRGEVDAWAGLDPIMADTVANEGAELVVREPSRNSYSVLNVREDFLTEHPEAVELVLTQYERARQWIQDNPEEAVEILATAAEIEPEIAAQVLDERTNLDIDPVPGEDLRAVLERIVPIVVDGGQVGSQEDAETALEELFAPEPATAAVESAGTETEG
ncbi:aliphatic sulfonate ABC transporter substrate-binding protein [Aquipuribacter sp. SD81]|uniref:aliphatic sulfonate ABC transporter substrate-binding protein n=1 Tax=Aquipuribacter sp. SD81 TaxID=3127703 RepID=UPI003019D586